MKKLFFSALVAVSVIGGAITSANAEYLFGGSHPIPCSTPPSATCGISLGLPPETAVYANPVPDQGPPIGTIGDYTYTGE